MKRLNSGIEVAVHSRAGVVSGGVVFAGYAAVFVCLTWPLACIPARAIVASGYGDGFFDMLLFWYARSGGFWGHVSTLFFPQGVALGAEKGFWLLPCLSVPLQFLMPLPLVYNLMCVLLFCGTGTAVYLLAREVGATDAGAFLAGALVVLSPIYLAEFVGGIPENMGLMWPVLYLWGGLRLRKAASLRLSVAAGLCFALGMLSSWYLGAFAVLFTIGLPLRRLLPGLLVAFALVLPPTMAVLAHAGTVEGAHVYNPATAYLMVTGKNLLTTPHAPPCLKDVDVLGTRQVLDDSADWSLLLTRTRRGRTTRLLPGALLLCLAVLGAWNAPRPTRRFLLWSVVFFCLSLGPWLVWHQRGVWVLPSAWAYAHLPLLARFRPIRWVLPMTVSLAVMSAFAVPRLRSKRGEQALLLLLLALQAFEGFWVQQPEEPFKLVSTHIPSPYRSLALVPMDQAIIDLPLLPHDLAQGEALYAQSVHHHPLLNYDFVTEASMRRLLALARANSFVYFLLDPRHAVRRVDVETMTREGFRWLVWHQTKARTPGARLQRALYPTLQRIFGPPRMKGEGVRIFDMQDLRRSGWGTDGIIRPEARSSS